MLPKLLNNWNTRLAFNFLLDSKFWINKILDLTLLSYEKKLKFFFKKNIIKIP